MGALVNKTHYSVGYLVGHDPDGFWQVTVVVKGTFSWDGEKGVRATQSLPIVEENQAPKAEADRSPVAVDLGPPKPRVDVLLAGALTFPIPIDQIDVSLSVGKRLKKIVRVFGDRHWLPGVLSELTPTRPVPTTSVPITWERSFGGVDLDAPTIAEARNPIGTGFAGKAASLERRLLPNFEDPQAPIGSWNSRPQPTGFGPVAAHWRPRVTFAGTYDDAWKRKRWPLPPEDFDPSFFNVAPSDQQLDGYRSGEEVVLDYMTTAGHDRFLLPDFEIPVTIETTEDHVDDFATVDTIVIEPSERQFSLVAKAAARLHPSAAGLRQIVVGHGLVSDDVAEATVAREIST